MGLGIHGEPGIRDEDRPSAVELGTLLTKSVLADAPENPGKRIGVIVNGLGVTKYEELFLLYRTIAPQLRDAGYEIIDPEVGEFVTSLDMGGVSLTIFWLDEELENLWTAPAYACAYRKDKTPLQSIEKTYTEKVATVDAESVVDASPAAAELASRVREATSAVAELMKKQERYLGEIDSYAGDGDHGCGMVRGAEAALKAVDAAPLNAGPSQLLKLAGRSWAMQAGGTSGVLWGASLEAAANTFADDAGSFTPDQVGQAVSAFADSMVTLGGAQVGDKTLLDSLLPFRDALLASTDDVATAWNQAAQIARRAAEETAALSPKKGRARPLAEKSVRHPDPGAVSMGMILELVGKYFS